MNEKDPRAVRTKNLIKESFVKLLEEKDFKYITIKDITTKATINRATFYAHYIDKYILLEELIVDCFEEMLPVEISNTINLTEDIIKELILFLYEYNINFYHTRKIDSTSIASTVDNLLKHKIDNLIEKILKSKAARDELYSRDINILVKLISSSIYSCAQYCYLNKNDKEYAIEKTLSFIMNGIRAVR
ncbi:MULTISPECIES: TetR family transcriptional regulator [unclassified Clostridium]|uniref:TetR family transcriptional regulator n=1 Tax=unclassified Clostridium TaxID=2614128 RepID=UPI0002973C89|nr:MULTISPECIES: TetR family transcriptional regulator [unclassified Clostridium]EKQ56142.1 MAG: transcriptional regulator [Clostridium sp. Maddingley MBC34-26]